MVITPTPQTAFDIVCIDTIGPFPITPNQNVYAITIQCELTKYLVTVPIPSKDAKTVAKAIFENFILIYGPMKEIRTDMGTEYVNQVLKNIATLFNISHKVSTAYHSQTIGGCERNHRTLNEYMRMYINETKTDWEDWIKYYTFCYNTTPTSYHNYTPYELVFGKKSNLPETFLNSKVDPLYNIEAYEQEIRYRLQVAQATAKRWLEKAKALRKSVYDKIANDLDIQIGDFVLVTNESRHKFESWFTGPYEVIGVQNPNCTVKDKKGNPMTIHKNRVRLYA